MGALPRVEGGGEQFFAQETSKAIQRAVDFTKNFGDKYASVEHLLLALVAERGVAADILKRSGATEKELIEAVRIDKLDCPQRFFKLGRRRALAISRLTVSVSGRLTDGRIDDLRVALGSAFPRPMCFPEITEAVQGERPTPELLRRIAAQTAVKLPEIAGVRASTLYKQPVSQKLLERLLGELFEVQYG